MASPGARQPVRAFGIQDPVTPSQLLDSSSSSEHSTIRRILGRVSLGGLRKSSNSPLAGLREREVDGISTATPTPSMGRAPVPTVMQSSGEAYTTPLPILSMIVLSITMLGEFLSANVSTPFLLFMVKGFGGMSDDSQVAFWTGILVSTFFLTQFLTSLLWATVAEKHGRRVVLVLSLLGSSVTCFTFGTSTTLQQAIVIRLAQGVFAGAVGVARGSVAFVTDSTNEGRAYAILGFCWGLGGVAGAIIGGSFERPATKWPGTFGDVRLFVTYPYLLPCSLAALVMLTGAFLGLFLDRDGGPKEGAIRLPQEKIDIHPPIPEEESTPPSPTFEQSEPRPFIQLLKNRISQRLSAYFASHTPHVQHLASPIVQPAVPMSSPQPRLDKSRTFSRTSRINGSAYGYNSSYRKRLSSNATTTAARRSSLTSTLRRRRGSGLDAGTSNEGSDLNFTQRLLMANENAVTNIADLWVAAAMNVENEDPFEIEDDDDGSPSDGSSEFLDLGEPLIGIEDVISAAPTGRGRRFSRSRVAQDSSPTRRSSQLPSHARTSIHVPSTLTSPQRRSTSRAFATHHSSVFGLPSSRRHSSAVPSIFSHPGVKSPPAFLEAQRLASTFDETHAASGEAAQVDVEALDGKQPSLTSQLPILVIVQYGMMALHTTTHDQIFMSYLVTDYASGGLNLTAGHFAQLIALMCLAQIAYQFYLYPNLGPPRGRFSHLSMFRVGSLLFIPSYLSVVLYRAFASPSSDGGNFILMIALALSTALRYCGSTFAYTAISILLNYMTPPSAVGYANGIAQSIVSLARCIGPSLGGYVWSVSIHDTPGGYYIGFVACAAFCGLSVLQSFLIR